LPNVKPGGSIILLQEGLWSIFRNHLA